MSHAGFTSVDPFGANEHSSISVSRNIEKSENIEKSLMSLQNNKFLSYRYFDLKLRLRMRRADVILPNSRRRSTSKSFL